MGRLKLIYHVSPFQIPNVPTTKTKMLNNIIEKTNIVIGMNNRSTKARLNWSFQNLNVVVKTSLIYLKLVLSSQIFLLYLPLSIQAHLI